MTMPVRLTRYPSGSFAPTAGLVCLLLLAAGTTASAQSSELPAVEGVELQPLRVHVQRLREGLDYLGAPLSDDAKAKLDLAAETMDAAEARRLIQEALDPLCLAGVTISPESRVKVRPGPAPRQLVQQGWRQFLVKVENKAGVTAPLRTRSDQARPVPGSPKEEVSDRWLDLRVYRGRPLAETLSGIGLEYRIVQLYSRDAGKRSAVLAFDVGQGTQDLGFRADLPLTFECATSSEVTFEVRDDDGEPTMAGFVIRDQQGRVYPSPAKRLEPDFAFHPQIYRGEGETLRLPPGTYTIRTTRGPEYLPNEKTVTVDEGPQTLRFELERWIDPSDRGWWSGDHHIHAAGCAHYNQPSQGVGPKAMMRHCLGEDVKFGGNLTWGPAFDYQKQFFIPEGAHPASEDRYVLRYDVEVSGFGSHQSGHLVLLNLREQIPPGGDSKHHWPTLCLNTLRWAQKQGAVCGPAHSGWGLGVDSDKLPNYEIPPYNGIGANEYIVDVTHKVPGPDGEPVPAVDFISMCDTPYVWEMNIWYHTLNCGFRTRISGETDFPCIYGERVGLGRSYAKIDGPLTVNGWVKAIERGAAYVGDGRSHLIDFTVGGVNIGDGKSELNLDQPGAVEVSAKVAAFLPEQPEGNIRDRHYTQKPYWHLERARLGQSREVPVELIVNGQPVARKRITADGELRDVTFEAEIDRSSWVAMRILPSSHTNPVFVLLDGEPIRASRRSAQWCLQSVDQCWSQKQRFIAEAEMEEARAAYEHARQTYRRILAESEAE